MTAAPKKPEVRAEEELRRMIHEPELLELIGISSVTLWRMLKKDQFPQPSYVSANRRIWFVDQIVAWQRAIDGQGRGLRNETKTKKTKSASVEADA